MAAYQVLSSVPLCHDLSFTSTNLSQGEYQDPNITIKGSLQKNKEKSELCNKFMMYGHCPYGLLCKFAHGSHELRQNNKVNNRYKTKKCESFYKDNYCHYGKRCNFKHSAEKEQNQIDDKWKLIYRYNRECIIGSKPASRLLELIKE